MGIWGKGWCVKYWVLGRFFKERIEGEEKGFRLSLGVLVFNVWVWEVY